MKTKEELIEQFSDKDLYPMFTLSCHEEAVYKSMDEYAKQQAIAFAVYLGGIMNGSVRARISVVGTTHFDDLYAQFIESLNK